MIDDELEEFRIWRQYRLKLTDLEEAFESLERIMDNPFRRGHDSAFKVMARCLVLLKKEIDKND